MTELAVHQRDAATRSVAHGDRRVLAEAERVELIDPGDSSSLSALTETGVALELRARQRIQRPALGGNAGPSPWVRSASPCTCGDRSSARWLPLVSVTQTTPLRSTSSVRAVNPSPVIVLRSKGGS